MNGNDTIVGDALDTRTSCWNDYVSFDGPLGSFHSLNEIDHDKMTDED